MKELNQLIDTQICVGIMMKHGRLCHDIYVSFRRIPKL